MTIGATIDLCGLKPCKKCNTRPIPIHREDLCYWCENHTNVKHGRNLYCSGIGCTVLIDGTGHPYCESCQMKNATVDTRLISLLDSRMEIHDWVGFGNDALIIEYHRDAGMRIVHQDEKRIPRGNFDGHWDGIRICCGTKPALYLIKSYANTTKVELYLRGSYQELDKIWIRSEKHRDVPVELWKLIKQAVESLNYQLRIETGSVSTSVEETGRGESTQTDVRQTDRTLPSYICESEGCKKPREAASIYCLTCAKPYDPSDEPEEDSIEAPSSSWRDRSALADKEHHAPPKREFRVCRKCNGTEMIKGPSCFWCGGMGRVPRNCTYEDRTKK